MNGVMARSTGRRRLTVCLNGVVTQFRGLPSGTRNRLRHLLAPFEVGSASPAETVSIVWQNEPPLWIVDTNHASRCGFRAETDLLSYLEWLPVAHASQAITQHVMIHAGAVVKETQTILLMGDSGAGKTTVTIGLTQRGWLPLSDDIALVSPHSPIITAFPRCFHVDEFTSSTIERPAFFEEAGALAGYLRPLRWANAPARVTCLVRLARDPASPSFVQPEVSRQARPAGG